MLSLLFLGDIVGKIGRKAVRTGLPELKRRYAPDLTIANIENATHGVGVSRKHLEELANLGIDAFTGGNHFFGHPEYADLLRDPVWGKRIARPANMRREDPGSGAIILRANDAAATPVLVMNLVGALAMMTKEPIENPFQEFDLLYASFGQDRPAVVFVDFHAELTAEKEAFGHFADGRASAVVGTHTHVQTSDETIFPRGTAYITDAGRTGLHHSVIGYAPESSVPRFRSENESAPYEIPEGGGAEIDGVFVKIDEMTSRASAIDRFRERVECS